MFRSAVGILEGVKGMFEDRPSEADPQGMLCFRFNRPSTCLLFLYCTSLSDDTEVVAQDTGGLLASSCLRDHFIVFTSS